MLREVKVGILVLAALAVFSAGIFLVGDRQQLFARKNNYTVLLDSTSGISKGGAVQLNGVNVGQVTGVVLPEDPTETQITVDITIDRRFASRIREDSLVRIKTLGLLGDKYIEISSGSVEAAEIPPGGQIPAAGATDVDRLIASGEDALANVVAISVSLRNILTRMEAGEGLLGELTAGDEDGESLRVSLRGTLMSMDSLLGKIDRGEGTLGVLFNDPSLAERLEATIARLETGVASFETGEGVLPALMHDAEMKDRFNGVLDGLETTTGELNLFLADVREGDGLLNKLLTDAEYSEKVSTDLQNMVENLSLVSEKLNSSDGTIGAFINDPSVYEAMNDILVGLDNSKFLRWLVRDRQKSGIKERYDEEVEAMEAEGIEPPPLKSVDSGGGR